MKFRIPEQTFSVEADGYFRVKIEALADEVTPMAEEVKTDAEVSQEPVSPETPEVSAPQETEVAAPDDSVNG